MDITDSDYHPLPGTPLRQLVDRCQADIPGFLADSGDIMLEPAVAECILRKMDEYADAEGIVAQAALATKIGWFIIHNMTDYAEAHYND